MIDIFPKSFVCWDLETTGFSPQNDQIVEVGVAIVRDGLVVEQWSSLVKFEGEMNEKAQAVHGITKEMCEKEGKPLEEVMKRLIQNILDAQAHVTHNGTRFDLLFVESALNALGTPKSLLALSEYHIDTAALYKADRMGMSKDWKETWHEFSVRVLKEYAPGVKYNVGACCNDLGISLENVQQHRTLGDVLLTVEIYKDLTKNRV